jgi:DNA-binding NtrC family response regulator
MNRTCDPGTIARARATEAIQARVAAGLPRSVGPGLCNRIYSAAEVEFMNAMHARGQATGRKFPSWSEILGVLRGLGYTKTDAAPEPPKPCPRCAHRSLNAEKLADLRLARATTAEACAGETLAQTVIRAEAERITSALEESEGSRVAAAKALGISLPGLYVKMAVHGLPKPLAGLVSSR